MYFLTFDTPSLGGWVIMRLYIDLQNSMLPEVKKNTLRRLATIRGHVDAVARMVEEEKYCIDILQQIRAIEASLENTKQVMVEGHLKTCFTHALAEGEGEKAIIELMKVLKSNR
jgi:CsoR family transcriptional regulator, copper-sensing transcriptional repressor